MNKQLSARWKQRHTKDNNFDSFAWAKRIPPPYFSSKNYICRCTQEGHSQYSVYCVPAIVLLTEPLCLLYQIKFVR